MDEIFVRVLAEAVAGYLAAAERGTDVAPVHGVAAAWRTLLRLHHPTARRRCPGCARRRGDMCQVWQVAIGYFVATASEPGSGRAGAS